MSQVLIGLIGVIVGGLLAALSSWFLDLSREKRHKRNQDQREARELKRAARLVGEELSETLYVLCRAVEFRRWWRHPGHSLRTTRWDEYEPVFAGSEVSDDVWFPVAVAYQVIRELLGAAGERMHDENQQFTVENDEDLRMCIGSIDEGRLALAELSGEPAMAMEPDSVAAVHTAAADAAHDLLADSGKNPPLFKHREELRVVSNDQPIVGVALLRPPNWVSYPCRPPLGSKLTVLIPAIEGTCACAVSPLGKRDARSDIAKKFVSDEIRLLEDYSDFVLLLQFPRDRALVSPWQDDSQ